MEPDQILADVRNFMKSRIILTAAELDLFTLLDGSPASVEELAGRRTLDRRAAERLLDCLVVYHLLDKKGDVYSLTDDGAYFSGSHPKTILPMVIHMTRLWYTWSELSKIVENGPDQQEGRGVAKSDEEWNWKSFIGAMHVAARKVSSEIAADLDLGGFKRLLDVGGGSGSYTIALLRKNPQMRAVLYDLEKVVPMAEERLAEEGLLDRVELVAGDFYKDELPKGCDLALLSAIIHQNGVDENIELYEKVLKALEPGGMLLIRDHVMEESRTKPASGAVFAINMLVNTRSGDTYTFEDIKAGLEKAGFSDVKLLRRGERMDDVVSARKPLH